MNAPMDKDEALAAVRRQMIVDYVIGAQVKAMLPQPVQSWRSRFLAGVSYLAPARMNTARRHCERQRYKRGDQIVYADGSLWHGEMTLAEFNALPPYRSLRGNYNGSR